MKDKTQRGFPVGPVGDLLEGMFQGSAGERLKVIRLAILIASRIIDSFPRILKKYNIKLNLLALNLF